MPLLWWIVNSRYLQSELSCKNETVNEDYKYTCEMDTKRKWTPLNSNLTMQGIKVKLIHIFQWELHQIWLRYSELKRK